jgi:tripartite-type tricarboxylate transporter receptor subunit TctC
MSVRNSSRRAHLGAALALTLPAIAPSIARAQSWPGRPIKLIVGFAPGGGTDIVSRILATKLSETLGQQVLVENRSGAAGTIAADLVAKSAADGYTLLAGHANSNAIAPNVMTKVPFDALNDFTPITYIGYTPNVLVIHPSIPAKSVEELVALAKSKPGVLTYASSGVGSTQHLAGALFNQISGTQMTHIPYKGSGQAVVDLVAGQVNVNFDTLPPVLEHIRAGRLRALAISSSKRMPQLPDVPTFEEKGIRGFDVTNWYSLMGPKGLPREIVSKLDDAMKKSLSDADVRSKLEPQGVLIGGAPTPEAFREFIRAENAKYAKLTRELNVRAD